MKQLKVAPLPPQLNKHQHPGLDAASFSSFNCLLSRRRKDEKWRFSWVEETLVNKRRRQQTRQQCKWRSAVTKVSFFVVSLSSICTEENRRERQKQRENFKKTFKCFSYSPSQSLERRVGRREEMVHCFRWWQFTVERSSAWKLSSREALDIFIRRQHFFLSNDWKEKLFTGDEIGTFVAGGGGVECSSWHFIFELCSPLTFAVNGLAR